MEHSTKTDIYRILGIDPDHKSPRSDENYGNNSAANRAMDSIVNDPDAPSGSIFDNYAAYPREQQGYWRYFRGLTITGIAVVVIVLGYSLVDRISFSSPTRHIDSEFAEACPEVIEEPTGLYGPFQTKGDLVEFLKNHFNYGGYLYANDIADNITTDYGKQKEFTLEEYRENAISHNARHHIVGYSHDIDENSVEAFATSDGGVDVSFSQTYVMTQLNDMGMEYSRQYDCKSRFRIDANRKIYYIWERATKTGEW